MVRRPPRRHHIRGGAGHDVLTIPVRTDSDRCRDLYSVPMVSESSVTAAVRANARPSTVTPVVTVIDANAMMVPDNTEYVPRVAELPTCQNTFDAFVPPANTT